MSPTFNWQGSVCQQDLTLSGEKCELGMTKVGIRRCTAGSGWTGMGKVESLKIWPISSNEMLPEGLYSDKLPYSWYVKNSRSKPLFKKSVRKKVYVNFMQIRN